MKLAFSPSPNIYACIYEYKNNGNTSTNLFLWIGFGSTTIHKKRLEAVCLSYFWCPGGVPRSSGWPDRSLPWFQFHLLGRAGLLVSVHNSSRQGNASNSTMLGSSYASVGFLRKGKRKSRRRSLRRPLCWWVVLFLTHTLSAESVHLSYYFKLDFCFHIGKMKMSLKVPPLETIYRGDVRSFEKLWWAIPW